MLKHRSQVLVAWFLFWDLLLTGAAWVGAFFLRFETDLIPLTKTPLDESQCLGNLPLVLLLAVGAYHLTGQYAIHRLRRLREEVVCVVKGTALLSLLVVAATFLRHDPYESRATLVLFTGLTVAALLLGRRLSWAAIRTLRSHGYNQTFSLIVGAGRVARKTERALRHASWMGIKNVGFVDEKASRL
jgi:FlaA1/EpsC-like NDP-sugar epimerase